jgi:hypothetical protein
MVNGICFTTERPGSNGGNGETECRATRRLKLGNNKLVGARPQTCKLAMTAVSKTTGLKQVAVATRRLDLSSFVQVMAKLNVGDFE